MENWNQYPRHILFLLSVFLSVFVLRSVASGQGLGLPQLPAQNYDYFRYAVTDLPAHFRNAPPPAGPVVARDNTPPGNQITNPGATLGRVLFYDRRLSHNNSVACASCHIQQNGFSDPRRLSVGLNGGETGRHSMGLSNAKFYQNGRFFWDERAPTLEAQVLQPIQDPVEMGSNLNDLITKLNATSYYGDLFQAAFGTPQITSDRISRALSQFVRSLVSYQSRFDSVFNAAGQPNFNLLTPQENQGRNLFQSSNCAVCHTTVAQIGTFPRNNGLDAQITDPGAGGGRFKVPSLRNIDVRERFMHDGRFASLQEVIEFYSNGVQNNPNLDPVMRGPNGQPIRFNFTPAQVNALIAFLRTLTDPTFLTSPMFSDPFRLPCDFTGDQWCRVDDLNLMLAIGPIAPGIPAQANTERYDLNRDGQINNQDVAIWLTIAAESNGFTQSYLPGDTDLDGEVDGDDLADWLENRFSWNTNWSSGDFNGDGAIDGQDFDAWNENKFTTLPRLPGGSLVPEPNLTLIALACLFWKRRLVRTAGP